MTQKLLILHLSDIHIAGASVAVLSRADAIAKATLSALRGSTPLSRRSLPPDGPAQSTSNTCA